MSLPPEDWRRLKEIFAGARALPVDGRSKYLDEACGSDKALRLEAEELLASHEHSISFLETPAMLLDDIASARNLEGQRIGPYHVASKIGAGGMGEVYKARDTRLNRQVAIKVLLPAVANDPDRLARFSREAQVLASLNHPHIAQIHGLEDADGVRALVMELVEGPTLADRIARGALPIDEALSIARQIAEALEAAHEQGIIHRDLKPPNIKVRDDGTVKVLDFGLAKALDTPTADVDALNSPAMSARATDASVILGTAAYMSPEQARGKAADRRADIWAFGCVLFEMLTGRQVFDGDSPTDVMAAIAKNEPDWTRLPAETPAPIRTLLRRCLAKDRAGRLDSATAARLEIEEALSASPAETPGRVAAVRRAAPVAITALAGGALVTALVTWVMTRPVPPPPAQSSRFVIVPSPDRPLNSSGGDRDIALSPYGRHLVYLAGGGLGMAVPLMVRATDQLEARQLAVAGIGVFPSPDSRWIGFFTNTEIKKVSITGGAAVSLCRFTGRPLGASWGDDNTIVFATDDPTTGLWRVSADGGEAT